MPKLIERVVKKHDAKVEAQAIANRIFQDEIENKAAKILLQHTLQYIDQDADALPVLVLRTRIEHFLRRHP